MDNIDTEYSDGCPRCGEKAPVVPKGCLCAQPMNLFIPNGMHIHLQCPVHGDVKMSGPPIRWPKKEEE